MVKDGELAEIKFGLVLWKSVVMMLDVMVIKGEGSVDKSVVVMATVSVQREVLMVVFIFSA